MRFDNPACCRGFAFPIGRRGGERAGSESRARPRRARPPRWPGSDGAARRASRPAARAASWPAPRARPAAGTWPRRACAAASAARSRRRPAAAPPALAHRAASGWLGSKQQRAQQQGRHAHEAGARLFTHLSSARVRQARFPFIHWALVRCRWAARWHSHPHHALRSVRRRAPLQPRCRRRPRRSRRAAPRRPRRRPGAAPAAPPPLPPAPRRAGSSRPRPWRLYQTAVFWKR